ncbi:MAG: hypothetical protein ACTTJI_03940 [Capnocytophaga sp.]|uniref:hypothetical protein n=1 Tax=Capnocytophaga sp. TaxID=44737 RepID=UPI003F9F39BC
MNLSKYLKLSAPQYDKENAIARAQGFADELLKENHPPYFKSVPLGDFATLENRFLEVLERGTPELIQQAIKMANLILNPESEDYYHYTLKEQHAMYTDFRNKLIAKLDNSIPSASNPVAPVPTPQQPPLPPSETLQKTPEKSIESPKENGLFGMSTTVIALGGIAVLGIIWFIKKKSK